MESVGLRKMLSKPGQIIFTIMRKVWDSLKCFKDVKKNRDCVESAGSQKMPRWKVILLSLWKVWVLRRFLDKMQQASAGSWLIAFYSISVKSAGCQKLSEYYAIKMILQSIIVECAGSQKIPC